MTLPNFNAPNGVVKEGEGDPKGTGDELTFKAVYIRCLNKARQYLDAETQEAIRRYVNIQYWSMATVDSDNASQPGWYGRNWTGPGYDGYTAQSQM